MGQLRKIETVLANYPFRTSSSEGGFVIAEEGNNRYFKKAVCLTTTPNSRVQILGADRLIPNTRYTKREDYEVTYTFDKGARRFLPLVRIASASGEAVITVSPNGIPTEIEFTLGQNANPNPGSERTPLIKATINRVGFFTFATPNGTVEPYNQPNSESTIAPYLEIAYRFHRLHMKELKGIS